LTFFRPNEIVVLQLRSYCYLGSNSLEGKKEKKMWKEIIPCPESQPFGFCVQKASHLDFFIWWKWVLWEIINWEIGKKNKQTNKQPIHHVTTPLYPLGPKFDGDHSPGVHFFFRPWETELEEHGFFFFFSQKKNSL